MGEGRSAPFFYKRNTYKMTKRKYTKKSKMEDTSSKSFNLPEVLVDNLGDFTPQVDEKQIDLEDLIEEEEVEEIEEVKETKPSVTVTGKLTKFKDPQARQRVGGVWLNNDNIVESDIQFLIDNNICSESDFC